ncbi:MAG: hypothetical protein K6E35_00235 [Bacteroidales bacterium]|nr:hypothetical protein [Bacteroidales bacterium]
MKKFFSLIALVGVIAACTPEQIKTAYKLDGADGSITVKVFNLDGTAYAKDFDVKGFESLPGTTEPVYTAGQAVISFAAAESQPIAQTVLTLTVSGDEILKNKTVTVNVPNILAGGHAELYAEVVVGELSDDYYFDVVEEEADPKDYSYKYGYLVNNHYATHAHSHAAYESFLEIDVPIDTWYINNSDLILNGTGSFTTVEGSMAGTVKVSQAVAGFEKRIADFVAAVEEDATWEVSQSFDFSVSAWAMWNAVLVQRYCPVTWTLTATPIVNGEANVAGKIDLATGRFNDTDFVYNVYELPYPGMPAHAHYEHGHGHGHGHGAENAGGGISINE